MDQLPGLLSWSWSLYTRHEVSTSTLIFMATTSSRRQRGGEAALKLEDRSEMGMGRIFTVL